MDAMAADNNTVYHVSLGTVLQTSGGGETRTIPAPRRSLWEMLTGRRSKVLVSMKVDPISKIEFTDTCENKFLPTTIRLLGHELGHGYTYLLAGPMASRKPYYDRAIQYENAIARELDPNAPMRAVSDHGRHGLLQGEVD